MRALAHVLRDSPSNCGCKPSLLGTWTPWPETQCCRVRQRMWRAPRSVPTGLVAAARWVGAQSEQRTDGGKARVGCGWLRGAHIICICAHPCILRAHVPRPGTSASLELDRSRQHPRCIPCAPAARCERGLRRRYVAGTHNNPLSRRIMGCTAGVINGQPDVQLDARSDFSLWRSGGLRC